MLNFSEAGVAQLVELQFSKLNVASSSLVARSNDRIADGCVKGEFSFCANAHVAQWQSTPLVRERSRVRFPPWAPKSIERAVFVSGFKVLLS